MSTIKTNTLTGTTTAGSILVTGEGGVETTNLQQGLAKAWADVDMTGTAELTTGSFNITGITDNGTGDVTLEITNDMGNVNYACSSMCGAVASFDVKDVLQAIGL